jgi:adenosylcobyric acid synthase
VINKFRGDLRLLEPGLEFLRERTQKPVLGVVPYVPRLRIADEDSVALETRQGRQASPGELDIAVIRLPHISNYDDVLALEHEPGVVVRFVTEDSELGAADLVILPGTKTTVADLGWLHRSGLAEELRRRAADGQRILGICGGCQMLGQTIEDPDGVESALPSVPGLALLELTTRFAGAKLTARVEAEPHAACFLTEGLPELGAGALAAYEIHMGQVQARNPEHSAFRIQTRNGARAAVLDGCINASGNVVGTLLHGLLENAELRACLLRALRARRGLHAPEGARVSAREAEYDRLEATVRASLDLPLLRRLARLT